MDPESAATLLRSKGYTVTPPRDVKIFTGCYSIICATGRFFMEGGPGEEEEVRKLYEKNGYVVKEVVFHEDSFFLY